MWLLWWAVSALLPLCFVFLQGNVYPRGPDLLPPLLFLYLHSSFPPVMMLWDVQIYWGMDWVCYCVAHCTFHYRLVPFKVSFSYFQEFPKVLSHVSYVWTASLAATLLPWCRQWPWALLFCWGFWSPLPPLSSPAIISLNWFELSMARDGLPEYNWDRGVT